MKKTFTKEYMRANKGCYSLSTLNQLSFMTASSEDVQITLRSILNSEISLKDKGWFLVKKCELSVDQKKQLALLLAEAVAPIYEKKYPEDKRVSECIQAIKKFNNGEITKDELLIKVAAAWAAAADADTAAAAWAAWAAAAADDDAYATAAAADAAAAHADDDAKCFKEIILQVMIDFCNSK